ncbi:YolD-like protein [Paenibacillus algorifonticola]|uniref:YolD-like protein n=1 Tax=Paenibacillus algorifonticola TaxID=684063 RepID=A0A1I1XWZ4_9BACL|nr:YolD-like family protein [Paenibacillus algorifonticola]SFE11729.1 YolD-like protein [Paenibacillus algorifonticola]
MSKKLADNGLWESSRIILPEHRLAYLNLVKERHRRGRIELDEQEKELISIALRSSYKHRVPLSIQMYDPWEALRVEGVVNAIADLRGAFRVEDDWYDIIDIERIEPYEDW